MSALLLIWVGIVGSLGQRDHRISLPNATLPIVGLLAVAILQAVLGFVPFLGNVWVIAFYCSLCVACICLGFEAGSLKSGSDGLTAFGPLAWALLFAAVVSTFIALIQVFELYPQLSWILRPENLRRPGANLAQPNHLATLQVMGVASLVYLHQAGKISSFAAALLLFTLALGISVTESRAGALSFLLLAAWWQNRRLIVEKFSTQYFGLLISVVLIGMFLGWPHLLDAAGILSQRPQSRALEGSMRMQVWPQLVHALLSRPWTGWGVLQVSAALNSVADQYSVSEPYTYSHNILLDFAIWIGAPLAAILTTAMVIWIGRRVRHVVELLPWYGIAIAIPFVIHSMFEYPFAYSFFLIPFMLLIGSVEARIKPSPWISVSSRSATIGALVLTIGFAWSVREYFAIEEDFRVARFEVLNVGLRPSAYEKPQIVLFDQLGLALDAVRIKPAPGMSREDLHKIKLAALNFPWTATQYRYAMALALNGDVVEAERQIQVMRRMWGERTYEGVKKEIGELAVEKYPQLRSLSLP